jgi:arginyl-tRNA synthetase
MMTIKGRLQALLQEQYPGEEVRVDYAPRDKGGDYSTNLALKTAPKAGVSPMAQAEKIADGIRDPMIERATVHQPGFVNFAIKREYLFERLLKEEFTLAAGGGTRVLVEFVSANPTGPMNIVSARAAAVGDALVRLLRAAGYQAFAEYYVNDMGRQAELLARSVQARVDEIEGREASLPEEGYHGEYLVPVAQAALKNGVHDLEELGKFAIETFIRMGQETMKRFNVVFDYWVRESEIYKKGLIEKVLESLEQKGLVYRKDGAQFFKAAEFGDTEDRVIVTSDNRNTYLLPDLAYHLDKIGRGYDRLINIWGPDHDGYVRRLVGGIKALGYPADKMVKILIVQEVKIKKGDQFMTMSKRAGTFATLDELLAVIPRDVARFFFLMRSSSQHLDFDLDLALKTSDENPVYYVQYAYARIKSIITFAQEKGVLPPAGADLPLDRLLTPEEMNLVKEILKLPEIIEDTVRNLEPYFLTYYLIDLARDFHYFYDRHRVVSDDPGLTQARLYLVRRTADALKRGCELIGISCPDKM